MAVENILRLLAAVFSIFEEFRRENLKSYSVYFIQQ
jgi:hypothetical protein